MTASPQPLRLLSLDDANIGLDDVVVRPAQPGLAARLLGEELRHSLRPSAWRMAIGRDRVLIRFLGILETDVPPEAPQVVELPFACVRNVRRLKRHVLDDKGVSYEFLEFRVQDCDLRPLQAVLLARRADRSVVAVTAGGALRVETSFQGWGVEPDTDEILRQLSEHVPLDGEAQDYIDASEPHRVLPEMRDEILRAVAETSVQRALVVARGMQPDASQAELEAHVMGLIACPDPAAAAARTGPAPGEVLAVPRILRRAEAEFRPGEHAVRPRATGSLLLAITFLALAGWVAWKYWTGTMHWGWAAAGGTVSLLLGAGILQGWRDSLRPAAWQMAIGPERILVPLRSYLNGRLLDDDPQILELPLAHLASVRATDLRLARDAPTERGVEHRYLHCLDFRTRGMDLGPLKEAVAAEGNLRADGSRLHVRVQVPDPDVVRVETGSNWERTTEMLRLLGEHLAVEEAVSEQVDTGGRRTRKLRADSPPARKQAPVRGHTGSG